MHFDPLFFKQVDERPAAAEIYERDLAVFPGLGRLCLKLYKAVSRLETLYLAAMDVSRQRFAYDVQFFGGGSLSYRDATNGDPRLTHSIPNTNNRPGIRAERTLATGGQWVVGVANTITWTLTGQGSWSADSLLNVGITQPLLREASRKFVLEDLTQAERTFLVALRSVVLFQQGHYARIVTGAFARNSGASTAGGGFYQLLESQIQIQNQRQNVISLEGNLSRFNEMFIAGQVNDYAQVAQMRQTLLTSQRQLLTQMNRFQTDTESYINSLGLPPDLNITISDPLLEQFQLTSPTLTNLTEDVGKLLAELRQREQLPPDNLREEARSIIRRAQGEIAVLREDIDMLQRSMPERIAGLKSLEAVLAERIANGARIHSHVYDVEEFENRVIRLLTQDIPRTLNRLQSVFTLLDLIANTEEQALREMIRNHSFDASVQGALESLRLSVPPTDDDADTSPQPPRPPQGDEYRNWVRRVFSVFQNELISLSLLQTRTRLDAMTLVPVSVTPEEAFQVASENRLDWMNERSLLVDAWRQLDITADSLKGVLDLDVRGRLGSIDGRGGNVNVGSNHAIDVALTWGSPLTRYNQMMNYRRSQINYQRARRTYYTYVDTVHSDLRNVLRNVQMSQINFEINRNAVLVGAIRADIMQLRMEAPPRRGGGIDTSLSEQLISALDGLMRSQNELLSTWVAFQTQRMLLDYHMGTMELDDRGRWIDPGVMGAATASPPVLAPRLIQIPVPVIAPPALAPPVAAAPVAVVPPINEVPRLNRRYIE